MSALIWFLNCFDLVVICLEDFFESWTGSGGVLEHVRTGTPSQIKSKSTWNDKQTGYTDT